MTISPFRLDLRREGGGDVVDFDSSEGREDGLYRKSCQLFDMTINMAGAQEEHYLPRL